MGQGKVLIEINMIYQIECQDQLYKTLPQALFFSPIIVVFSALTLLLLLSGVFAPGSLTITMKNSTNISDCMIPIGNVSTHKYDSNLFFNMYSNLTYIDPVPRAKVLTTWWLVKQSIPDLPQACRPNCCYKVHVPSFVFQCTTNPSLLLHAQIGDPSRDSQFGMGWQISIQCLGFTLHRTQMTQMECGEMHLAWLFKPNMMSRFR